MGLKNAISVLDMPKRLLGTLLSVAESVHVLFSLSLFTKDRLGKCAVSSSHFVNLVFMGDAFAFCKVLIPNYKMHLHFRCTLGNLSPHLSQNIFVSACRSYLYVTCFLLDGYESHIPVLET